MRSGRAPLLVAALVWVLVVAVVGAVTYLVVERAGREIRDTSTSKPIAAASLPIASATPSPSPSRSSPRPSPTPTRTVKKTPTPRATATPPPPPPPPPATRTPESTPTTSSTPTRTTPTTSSRTKTFASPGGTVTVTCTGDRMRLNSITPRNGWRVEERHLEGDRIEVKFRSGESEDEVKIRCRDGVPTRESDD